MDILNNIWGAISVPNEGLINICMALLAIFIEGPLSLYLILNLFDIKTTKRKSLSYITVFFIISILSISIIKSPFNIILNYISSYLMFYFIFKLTAFKTLIASLFPSIVFSLSGVLFTNTYLSIFNITNEQLVSIPIYRVSCSFIIYLFVFLVALCFKYKKFKINILDNFDKKNKYIILLNFLFGILYIIVQMILTFNYTDILPISYTFFSFICLLFYFVLSFYTLTRIIKLVTTTQKLESAEEYNKTLHILHDNVRCFKHDFDNIVTTIGGYVKTNDINGLEKYYSQLQEDCEKVNNLYILNPDIINNPRYI